MCWVHNYQKTRADYNYFCAKHCRRVLAFARSFGRIFVHVLAFGRSFGRSFGHGHKPGDVLGFETLLLNNSILTIPIYTRQSL
jgi:hypothetical protein